MTQAPRPGIPDIAKYSGGGAVVSGRPTIGNAERNERVVVASRDFPAL